MSKPNGTVEDRSRLNLINHCVPYHTVDNTPCEIGIFEIASTVSLAYIYRKALAIVKRELTQVCKTLLAAMALLVWASQIVVVAQEQASGFKVGDVIEFEFLGRLQQQAILEINPNGLLRVEAESNGNKRKVLVPPKKAVLVPQVESGGLPDDFRTWTDSTGKFNVEASFIELNGKEVKLLKKDDLVISLPLEKLSQADQLYLQQLQEMLQKQTVESSREMSYAELVESVRIAFESGKLPTESRALAPTNEVQQVPVAWSYTPTDSAKHTRDQSIPFPKSISGIQKVYTDLYDNGYQSDIINVHRRSYREKIGHIHLVDTSEEKSIVDFTLPTDTIVGVGVTPSLTTLATLHRFEDANSGGIVCWKIDNDRLIPLQSWNVGMPSNGSGVFAPTTMFISDKHLLTIGSHIAVWNWEEGSCMYSVSDPGAWAISRDRSHVVFAKGGSLWLLRLSEGKIVGRLNGDSKYMDGLKQLDFSPDGKYLLLTNGHWLVGFDLTNGQELFSIAREEPVKSAEWADNSLLFLDNSEFYHPRFEAIMWNVMYHPSGMRVTRGSTTWIDTGTRLYSVELVDEHRRNAISAVTARSIGEKSLTFERGTKIALKTDLQHLDGSAAEVTKGLRRRLEESGFVIDDAAPLRLEALVHRFPAFQESIRGTLDYVSFTPHTSQLTLLLDDKKIWQYSDVKRPRNLNTERNGNETHQAAADRLCRPDPAFFMNTTIPSKVSTLPLDRKTGLLELSDQGASERSR